MVCLPQAIGLTPNPNLVAQQLFRDRFFVVCNPSLLSQDRLIRTPSDLGRYPLIDCFWSPSDSEAPTWSRWETRVRSAFRKGLEIGSSPDLSFREESHGIEAAIAGQELPYAATSWLPASSRAAN
jgi:LysR family transcriptional regulator, glycine cleavage system transcriptional activator